MDELEAGIELSLAIFPKSSAFLKPSKGALDDPALGNNGKGMKLTALSDLDGSAQFLFDGLSERFARIATVS